MAWLALLLAAQTAYGEAPPCPGIGHDGNAADHALCWYDAAVSGSGQCAAAGASECMHHASGWCAEAPLDAARVSNACLLAHVRSGEFEQAREVGEYLSDPTPEVLRCRAAVTDMMRARIVSNPAGGDVSVDGRSYGAAPVETQLAAPWWERRITVTFGNEEAVVSPEQLRAAFDAQSCRLGDVVVAGESSGGPSGGIVGYTPATAPPVLAAPTTDPPTTGGSYVQSPEPADGPADLRGLGWGLTIAGGATAIAALVTGLMAESTYQDLEASCDGMCPADRSDDVSRGKTLATTSTVTAFIGGGLILAGLTVLLFGPSGEDESDDLAADADRVPTNVRATGGPGLLGLGAEVSF